MASSISIGGLLHSLQQLRTVSGWRLSCRVSADQDQAQTTVGLSPWRSVADSEDARWTEYASVSPWLQVFGVALSALDTRVSFIVLFFDRQLQTR